MRPSLDAHDDPTAIIQRKRYSSTNKTLAILLGICGAVCPAVASYFAYRQAKIEANAKAARGYESLAEPLEEARGVIRKLNQRVKEIEEEHHAPMSKDPDAESKTPAPIDIRALESNIPRTLNEAAAKR